MLVCWLRSFTRITYLNKLIRIHSLAAFLQLELFWVYIATKNAIKVSITYLNDYFIRPINHLLQDINTPTA
ncbi:hypothetical protein CWC46_11060 [Prodigiosinella confusarubida]|uniref:Uncharacterized protein n=1 Tax=Serratia sp. (strain ATCC 39006) TaxID=104623 RepID=A0A2I5T6V6_SERS3|nr:hypothetical protein CWC46_11060 [Serratia sp. ATCC 39006]AUH04618.1 hypothetical protein Ser39006_011065 [Serratia sp. ATCC 39006]